jgi:hypothetical protein
MAPGLRSFDERWTAVVLFGLGRGCQISFFLTKCHSLMNEWHLVKGSGRCAEDREALPAGWSLAEIKRTAGSHSAKDHPAGDAGTRNCHWFVNNPHIPT